MSVDTPTPVAPLATAPPDTSAPAPTAPPGDTFGGPLAAAHSSYQVGAYYFSGWSHGPNDNLSPLLMGPLHLSEPLIGWYDDSQQAVDKSIDQAANAGITFFAFDWYDVAQSPYVTDKTLNEALGFYLTSARRYRLKFCLNWIDYPPFVPPASEWPALVDTWINYFKQPGYETVNGKPLFIIFSPEHLRDMFGGSAGVRQALDYLRQQARQAGLPGVSIAIAATIAPHANPIHIQQLNAEGYDAATGYSYHSLGGEQYNVAVPYERLVQENVEEWNRVAANLPIPYIPVVTSGFDLRYSQREQNTAIIYAGRTPDKFACFAALARHWVDTHPAQTTKERIVLIYAWTEMGEGGAIIPDWQDGYAYSDAVRTIFGAPGQLPATPPYCSAWQSPTAGQLSDAIP